ncbi:MAG: hypothetical protein ABIG55_04965 [Candidatus Omnitrophota bacterium]|nr:hypothetical protein [Candidatus Omnitrophota bacterium]
MSECQKTEDRKNSLKMFFVSILLIGVLLFLNGCAVMRPISQLVGGVANIASGAVGMVSNAAVKAAPAVLPFLFLL